MCCVSFSMTRRFVLTTFFTDRVLSDHTPIRYTSTDNILYWGVEVANRKRLHYERNCVYKVEKN